MYCRNDISLSFPGSLGMNGSLSTDRQPVHLRSTTCVGSVVELIKQIPQSAVANTGGEAVNAGMGAVPMKGTPYSVNKNRFMSPLGIPCQKPPFGSLCD
ncbi:hypothetical protein ACVXG7_29540 [Enterobacter hormaechei]